MRSRAQAFFGGKWTENPDDAHVRAFGHLHIFWGIAHVNAVRGFQSDALKSKIQRAGVWLLMFGITTADASVKRFGEAKFAELSKDAVAVSAGHQTQLVPTAYGGKDLTGAGD